ncbi:phage holin family protein [Enterobacter cloacae complex sp. I2]|uniref:phage holin family protein n=1 Tax=Enterobacter cloacae complex sp. I2 TaxID=2779603 RepID=UPI001866B5B1|nr:phage holin family protein [Enterobacter cloacae complex sp. I2]MBE3510123.1 phage holin family protein [Enterobacter cloacae complex sp. I2]
MNIYVWLLQANALACLITMLRLLVVRKRERSRIISLVAYALILACGWKVFRICTGTGQTDWAQFVINLSLCVTVLFVRGKVSKVAGGLNG